MGKEATTHVVVLVEAGTATTVLWAGSDTLVGANVAVHHAQTYGTTDEELAEFWQAVDNGEGASLAVSKDDTVSLLSLD